MLKTVDQPEGYHDDARKGARKGKGNIVMVGKKGNKVRLEIVQNLLSLRL